MALTLSQAQSDKLKMYLRSAVTRCRDQMEIRAGKVREAVSRWEAKTKPKSWPLGPRSSSIHVPTVAIIYDAVGVRMMNAMFGQDKDITVVPVKDGDLGVTTPSGRMKTWSDVCVAVERYFLQEASAAGQIGYRRFVSSLFDEGLMTGTAFPSTAWERTIEYDISKVTGKSYPRETYNNVLFDVAPLENHYFPAGYDRLDRIPLFGSTYLARPSELLNSIDSDGWNKEEVRRFLRDNPNARASVRASDLTFDEGYEDRYDAPEILMGETWLRFPLRLEKNFPAREVKILVDHPIDYPDYIFRVIPWPYDHGRMKYAQPFRYIQRRRRLLGMGIPERLESMDDAISAVVNQIIDAGTVANCPVWSIDENIEGVRDSLVDIYPGKVIPRGEDAGAVTAVKMGSVGPDIFEGYNILREITERLGKVTDYNLGRESSAMKGAGTATTTLALLGETGQYFDARVREGRETINDCNQMWLDLMVQHKPLERVAELLDDETARDMMAALVLPPGDLRKKVAVKVSFSSTAATRELARQEEAAKIKILQEYYAGLLQISTVLVQEPYKATLVNDIANDADKRMRALLEAYGDRNVDSLPDWQKFIAAATQEIQQAQNAPNPELELEKQKAEIEGQKAQGDLQIKQAEAQLRLQQSAMEHDQSMQQAQSEHEMSLQQQGQQMQFDQQRMAMDNQMAGQRAMQDMALRDEEARRAMARPKPATKTAAKKKPRKE